MRISNDCLHQLHLHSWPGNIRELKNTIERAFFLAFKENEIKPEHLCLDIGQSGNNMHQPYKKIFKLKELEKEAIEKALQKTTSAKEVAEMLGISRSTLYRKMKQFNVKQQ
jgi:limonene hydroxylase